MRSFVKGTCQVNPPYLRVAVAVRLVSSSPLVEESVSLNYKRSGGATCPYLFLCGFVPEVYLAAYSRVMLRRQFVNGVIVPL